MSRWTCKRHQIIWKGWVKVVPQLNEPCFLITHFSRALGCKASRDIFPWQAVSLNHHWLIMFYGSNNDAQLHTFSSTEKKVMFSKSASSFPDRTSVQSICYNNRETHGAFFRGIRVEPSITESKRAPWEPSDGGMQKFFSPFIGIVWRET